MEGIITIVVIVVVAAIFIFGILAMVARFYRQVEQGKALIVNTLSKEPVVTFTGGVVLPIVNRAELMDLSVKTIQIDRRGKEGLIRVDQSEWF
jgi:uncharacterized membrane protein YqiK